MKMSGNFKSMEEVNAYASKIKKKYRPLYLSMSGAELKKRKWLFFTYTEYFFEFRLPENKVIEVKMIKCNYCQDSGIACKICGALPEKKPNFTVEDERRILKEAEKAEIDRHKIEANKNLWEEKPQWDRLKKGASLQHPHYGVVSFIKYNKIIDYVIHTEGKTQPDGITLTDKTFLNLQDHLEPEKSCERIDNLENSTFDHKDGCSCMDCVALYNLKYFPIPEETEAVSVKSCETCLDENSLEPDAICSDCYKFKHWQPKHREEDKFDPSKSDEENFHKVKVRSPKDHQEHREPPINHPDFWKYVNEKAEVTATDATNGELVNGSFIKCDWDEIRKHYCLFVKGSKGYGYKDCRIPQEEITKDGGREWGAKNFDFDAFDADQQKIIGESLDLDNEPEEPHQGPIAWLARDNDQALWIFVNRPTKDGNRFVSEGKADCLMGGMFLNITWKNSPQPLILGKE